MVISSSLGVIPLWNLPAGGSLSVGVSHLSPGPAPQLCRMNVRTLRTTTRASRMAGIDIGGGVLNSISKKEMAYVASVEMHCTTFFTTVPKRAVISVDIQVAGTHPSAQTSTFQSQPTKTPLLPAASLEATIHATTTTSSAVTSCALRAASGTRSRADFRNRSPATEPTEFASTTAAHRHRPAMRSFRSRLNTSGEAAAAPSASACTVSKASVAAQIVAMESHCSLLYLHPGIIHTERNAVHGRMSCVESFTVPASTCARAATVHVLLTKNSAATGIQRATLHGCSPSSAPARPSSALLRPSASTAETPSCTSSSEEGRKRSEGERPWLAQPTSSILATSARM
mmetsp:Transcript_25366/g.72223  ORF Transcript_25366/g.72223 Transcript_25366/m.72223 type:complete len:343 (+) Transcript_25366:248-1276(+)